MISKPVGKLKFAYLTIMHLDNVVREREGQIMRLRNALEFYADSGESIIDGGEVAREALEDKPWTN